MILEFCIGGRLQTEVAEHMGTSVDGVRWHASVLEKKGLLERHKIAKPGRGGGPPVMWATVGFPVTRDIELRENKVAMVDQFVDDTFIRVCHNPFGLRAE